MAEPFHCDYAGRLFMSHLGNHLINAADFHSNDRGFGMLYLNTIHKTWVLSRLSIELDEMPPAYTKFNVETWVESAMRFFTNRNFRISLAPEAQLEAEEPRAESKEPAARVTSESPKVFGYGRSVWAMIDTETRQPADQHQQQVAAHQRPVHGLAESPVERAGHAVHAPHIRRIWSGSDGPPGTAARGRSLR